MLTRLILNLQVNKINSVLTRTIQISSINNAAARKNFAIVLSGSGVYDGSEIIESTSCAIHLSKLNADVSFYAPNIKQLHVINHLNGEVLVESRNVLQESARIARGKILPLDKLKASEHAGLVIPGGFGVAKNLSNYATHDNNMTVIPDIERIIKEFILARKPIGLCCIAPILIAKVDPNVEITVGMENNDNGKWPYTNTATSVRLLGAKNVPKDVNEIHVDKNARVVTTPAFMKDAQYHEVYEGIGKMIQQVVKLSQ